MYISNNNKQCFVSFSEGDDYKSLMCILEESISKFSSRPILIYSASDFEIKWEPSNWEYGYIYIYKLLACRKALEEYEEVVWLDSDIVVTNIIDDIWKFKNQSYPLLPRYRFYNIENWPHPNADCNSPEFLSHGKTKIPPSNQSDGIYRQACCMKMDRSAIPFLDEAISYFGRYDSLSFPLGDESILNLMLWRVGYPMDLGSPFICSLYYNIDLICYILSGDNREERLGLLDTSQKILFLHGCKDSNLNKRILDSIK